MSLTGWETSSVRDGGVKRRTKRSTTSQHTDGRGGKEQKLGKRKSNINRLGDGVQIPVFSRIASMHPSNIMK